MGTKKSRTRKENIQQAKYPVLGAGAWRGKGKRGKLYLTATLFFESAKFVYIL